MADARRRLDARPLLIDHPLALRISLFFWAVGGSLFVALAVPATFSVVQSIDDAVYRLAIDLEQGVVVGVARVFDFVGSTVVAAPVMIAVAVFLLWKKRWEALGFWMLAMVGSQLLIGPIKVLYERPRPPLPLVETTSFSFPSGHAVVGAAIAISLVIVLFPAGPKRRNWEMLAAAFATLMALSRVYLRAHWLSDVVAGVALGAAVAIGAAAIVHLIDRRRHRT